MADGVGKGDWPPFFGNGFRTLWLQDSVLQIVFAIIFAVVAIRPAAATRFVVVILGLLPITTAILIYHFIGNFIGGHIFLARGLAPGFGGLVLPSNSDQPW